MEWIETESMWALCSQGLLCRIRFGDLTEMLRNSLVLLLLIEMFYSRPARPKGTEDVSAHSGIIDFWMDTDEWM